MDLADYRTNFPIFLRKGKWLDGAGSELIAIGSKYR
jgi:hypothetical protein